MAFHDRLEALRERRLAAPVNIRIKPINHCNHDCWYCAYLVGHLQLGDWVLETPRGMVDDGLSMEEVARMEIKEEGGSEFLSFHDLGIIHTTSGITPEVMHLVAGEITPPGEVGHGEGIAQAIGFTVSEIERMIGDGRITDAPTIAAYMRARLAGLT